MHIQIPSDRLCLLSKRYRKMVACGRSRSERRGKARAGGFNVTQTTFISRQATNRWLGQVACLHCRLPSDTAWGAHMIVDTPEPGAWSRLRTRCGVVRWRLRVLSTEHTKSRASSRVTREDNPRLILVWCACTNSAMSSPSGLAAHRSAVRMIGPRSTMQVSATACDDTSASIA